MIDVRLNLYEQQASVNPNMSLRDLYYVTEELKKIAPPGRLHRTTKVKIPAPKIIVFYNGKRQQPERQVYRLLDLFSRDDQNPELELKVMVININPGYNRELLDKCESLRGYMAFVEKARNKKASGIKLEQAVRQAVDECISEGVLDGFFKRHSEEVIEMGIYEFDQELHDQVLLEDGEAIGLEKGKAIGREEGVDIGIHIYREILKGRRTTVYLRRPVAAALKWWKRSENSLIFRRILRLISHESLSGERCSIRSACISLHRSL